MTSRLEPGESLDPGDHLRAENGPYFLQLFAGDNHLSLRTDWGERRWVQRDVAKATMRKDGDFVATDSNGDVMWSSETSGNDGAWLQVHDDGNLVVMQPDGSGTLWRSNTALDLSNPERELARRIIRW